MSQIRIEKDSMGPVEIPAEMIYGAQTERARRNFPISRLRFDRGFLYALGTIKRAAAEVNEELGLLDPERADRNLLEYLALEDEIGRRVGAATYIDLRWRDRIAVMPEPSNPRESW